MFEDPPKSFYKCCRKILPEQQHQIIPNPKCTSFKTSQEKEHQPIPIKQFNENFQAYQKSEQQKDSILNCKNTLFKMKVFLDDLFSQEYQQVLQIQNQIKDIDLSNQNDWYSYTTMLSEFNMYNGDDLEFDDDKYEQIKNKQCQLIQDIIQLADTIHQYFGDQTIEKIQQNTKKSTQDQEKKQEKTPTQQDNLLQSTPQHLQQQFGQPNQFIHPHNQQFHMMQMGMPPMGMPPGMYQQPPQYMGQQFYPQHLNPMAPLQQQQQVIRIKKKHLKTDKNGVIQLDEDDDTSKDKIQEEKETDEQIVNGVKIIKKDQSITNSSKTKKNKQQDVNLKMEQQQLPITSDQNILSESNPQITNQQTEISENYDPMNCDANAVTNTKNLKIEEQSQIPGVGVTVSLSMQEKIKSKKEKDDKKKKNYSSDDWHKILLFYVKSGMDTELTMSTFNVSKKNLQRQKNNFMKRQKKAKLLKEQQENGQSGTDNQNSDEKKKGILDDDDDESGQTEELDSDSDSDDNTSQNKQNSSVQQIQQQQNKQDNDNNNSNLEESNQN